MARDKDTCPVRWAGRQAITTLPEQIDVSNAGQIGEQLLSVINRGAAALIADMTATVSCDHAGADALVRAPAVPEAAGLSLAADPAGPTEELLDRIVTSIFDVGVSMQAATDLPRDAARKRTAEALQRLDDVVREVRRHVFAERIQDVHPGPARQSPPCMHERLAQTAERAASLQERVVQTAHALQMAAADTAALLEQRADLAGQPARIDYPTEIKRWRAFANQAEQMAKNWEQRP